MNSLIYIYCNYDIGKDIILTCDIIICRYALCYQITMAVLQNRSSQLLKYTRLFNYVSVTRLSSNIAKSSAEVIQREKKVSANNYDPSPVVITRGEGYYLIVLLYRQT